MYTVLSVVPSPTIAAQNYSDQIFRYYCTHAGGSLLGSSLRLIRKVLITDEIYQGLFCDSSAAG
jgi:hypothetical protein